MLAAILISPEMREKEPNSLNEWIKIDFQSEAS